MNEIFLLTGGSLALVVGAVLGYYARQSIARKRADTIETTLQKRVAEVKKETEEMQIRSQEKASQIIEQAKREINNQKQEIFKTEKLLMKRENMIPRKPPPWRKKKKIFSKSGKT